MKIDPYSSTIAQMLASQRLDTSERPENRHDSRDAESAQSMENTNRAAMFAPQMVSTGTSTTLLEVQETKTSSPANYEQTESTETQSTAVTDFLEYMSKTPEERLYEKLLAEEGYTKEQLEKLPLELREKIEERIKEKMKEILTGQSGIPGQMTGQTDLSV